jgi:hypothetical protein
MLPEVVEGDCCPVAGRAALLVCLARSGRSRGIRFGSGCAPALSGPLVLCSRPLPVQWPAAWRSIRPAKAVLSVIAARALVRPVTPRMWTQSVSSAFSKITVGRMQARGFAGKGWVVSDNSSSQSQVDPPADVWSVLPPFVRLGELLHLTRSVVLTVRICAVAQ